MLAWLLLTMFLETLVGLLSSLDMRCWKLLFLFYSFSAAASRGFCKRLTSVMFCCFFVSDYSISWALLRIFLWYSIDFSSTYSGAARILNLTALLCLLMTYDSRLVPVGAALLRGDLLIAGSISIPSIWVKRYSSSLENSDIGLDIFLRPSSVRC